MKKIMLITFLLFTQYILADIEKGKAVYNTYCVICHTVDNRLSGSMGPDFNLVSYKRKKFEIMAYVRTPDVYYKEFGYSANAMPSLDISDKDLEDVADYISSLQPFKKWMIKKKK
jgi:mono/diheme cytochrome c family protein